MDVTSKVTSMKKASKQVSLALLDYILNQIVYGQIIYLV